MLRAFLLLLVVATSSLAPLRGAVIIGNLAAYTNDDGQSGNGSVITGATTTVNLYSGKAIGFTLGDTAYDLTSVTLRLKNVAGTTDAPSISIWTNNGANLPGVQVGSYLTNPVSFEGATASNYVFTAAGPLTLNASASYFLVVQQLTAATPGVTDVSFSWLNGSPTVTPAGIATGPIGRTTSGSVASPSPTGWTLASSNFNWFQIDGTVSVVPEVATLPLLGAGAVLGGLVLLRRRRA